jgi:hypothetical protein
MWHDAASPRMLPPGRSLYVGCDGGLVRLSPGPGDSLEHSPLAPLGPDAADIHAVHVDPGAPGLVVVATAAGSRRSEDHGRHWHDHSGELPPGGAVPEHPALPGRPLCVAVDPAEPQRVAVGLDDGSVWLSVDGGADFRALSRGLAGRVKALAFADTPPPEGSVPSDSILLAVPPGAPRPAIAVGQVHEVTIVDEIERPVIGQYGVCKLGDADMRLPGARKGERYRVRVLALAVNQWTGRVEATVQKLAGPLT